ncbi:beta-xylosidase/alpha-L-arabinofuranosidase 1-like [Jatropha curcas]|uniref:beta-xylosidase/alpha-L-arabinofuranosidase 1-like n=1 Tax=Jatropha curcas TaxID=180498 RepID=UPI001895EFF3|nr:beta-xylosidase/alpha-L-arabinofuranosidase 1-like [Jatropha curcas]
MCSEQHIELAAQAARDGIVLLKNNDDTLPLKSDTIKTLAMVGPHANATKAMIGNYAGIPCRYFSPIDGFSTYAKVSYAIGCVDVACRDDKLVFPAMQVAQEADATIIVAGIDLPVEAETRDREDLLLPGYQTELFNNVANAAKGPIILVIMSAGGIDITFAKNNVNIKAILWARYPGVEGGRAIADVVFGKYNPGGRLPLTWHQTDFVDQLPKTSLHFI